MSDTLAVPFDEDVLLVTGMTPQEFIENTRFTVAAKLWMDGKITAGQAAKLCGMGKVAFLNELPRHGYPMSNISPDDLKDDLQFARRG